MSATTPQSPMPSSEAGERQGPSPWSLVLLVALVALIATGHWALVVAVLGLALLIFVHELGHFLAAKAFHMRVERFYIGFPPAVVKRTRGETEYGIGVIPLGGFCKISGMAPDEKLPDEVVPRAYVSKPVWQRNITIAAGPVMNFVAAVVIMFFFILSGGFQQPSLTIAQVVKGTPAAAAGLRAGDRLVAADGRTFTSWDATTTFFESHPHQMVTLTYRTPAGQLRTTTVTLTTRPGEPGKGFLGVGPKATPIYPSPWRAVGQAFTKTAGIVAATFQGLWMLVSGKIEPAGPDGAAGPVASSRSRRPPCTRAGIRSCWPSFRSTSGSSTCCRSCRSTAGTSSSTFSRPFAAAGSTRACSSAPSRSALSCWSRCSSCSPSTICSGSSTPGSGFGARETLERRPHRSRWTMTP